MILYFLERSKFTKNIPLDNRYEVIIRRIVYRVPIDEGRNVHT